MMILNGISRLDVLMMAGVHWMGEVGMRRLRTVSSIG